jgi:hypothetical protein
MRGQKLGNSFLFISVGMILLSSFFAIVSNNFKCCLVLTVNAVLIGLVSFYMGVSIE